MTSPTSEPDTPSARQSATLSRRKLVAAALFIGAVALVAAFMVFQKVQEAAFIPDVPMIDHHGHKVRFSDFRGKWLVLYFGYTHCPDACPTGLSELAKEMRALGPDRSRVKVFFITVDPARDTVHLLASYVPYFDSSFLGVRLADADLSRLSKRLGVVYKRVGNGKDYAIDHTVNFFVIDPHGVPKSAFFVPLPPGMFRRCLELSP